MRPFGIQHGTSRHYALAVIGGVPSAAFEDVSRILQAEKKERFSKRCSSR